MTNILEHLDKGEILLSDGAWGTMLQAKGLKGGECPEQWNITHRNEVKPIGEAYIKAGSDMILTNTFGGSRFKLAGYGLENKVREFNKEGAAISKEAAGSDHLVAASVGPTGKFLQPVGDVSESEMYEVFCEQISALAEGGADMILVETMADLGEASLAIKAARDVTDLPVLATMTFEKGKKGYRTMMGVTIEQAVERLLKAGADIIGTNCGNGIVEMTEIIAEMRKYTNAFLLAHPNAGKPKLVKGKTVFTQTPEGMASHVRELVAAGANIVGGCCGTGPEHIAAMAKVLKG